MGSEVTVKGQAFRSVLAAVEELRGEPFCAQVLSRFPGDGGEMLRAGTLLASSFYPVAWYSALLRSAVDQADGAFGFAREIGLTSGRREVRGIYRLMFRMLATETLVRQAPRFYQLFYSSGQVEVTEARSGFGSVRYSECHGFDFAVWQDLLGGAEAGFEATGAKGLSLRVEAGGRDGDTSMVVAVRWS